METRRTKGRFFARPRPQLQEPLSGDGEERNDRLLTSRFSVHPGAGVAAPLVCAAARAGDVFGLCQGPGTFPSGPEQTPPDNGAAEKRAFLFPVRPAPCCLTL